MFFKIALFSVLLLGIQCQTECDISGLCTGDVIQELIELNINQCWKLCHMKGQCTWFSYNTQSWNCILYRTCPEIEENDQFLTGQKDCQYPILSKLLVTTGRLTDKGQHTEVIDLANPDSKCDPLPDYPIQIFGATGGLLQDSSPIVCGGFDGSDLGRISQCYIIDGNETLQTIDLNIYRWNSASVLLDKNTLWITGGYEFESVLYSTEYVKLDQSTAIAGPNLNVVNDYVPFYHCMTKLNETTVISTGGLGNYGKTLIIDVSHEDYLIIPGPKMEWERNGHACGTFISNGKIMVIVVGGSDDLNFIGTTEIWDPSSDKGWVPGPPLPVSCGYPSLVTSHDGQRVYVVGCKEDGRGGKDIYELNTLNGSELEWMTLSDKITNQRFDTVSMLIPDELTNCEE